SGSLLKRSRLFPGCTAFSSASAEGVAAGAGRHGHAEHPHFMAVSRCFVRRLLRLGVLRILERPEKKVLSGSFLWVVGLPVAQLRMSAAQAELLAGGFHKAPEVHAFATARADGSLSLIAWQVGWIDGHAHPLRTK